MAEPPVVIVLDWCNEWIMKKMPEMQVCGDEIAKARGAFSRSREHLLKNLQSVSSGLPRSLGSAISGPQKANFPQH
jgi:hypothetical protein